MTITMGGMVSDAAAIWRRERDVIVRIASLFYFLPGFALLLFIPRVVIDKTLGDEARMAMQLDAFMAMLPWQLGVVVVQLVGTGAIILLLLDRARPSVGDAIRATLFVLPMLLAAQVITLTMVMGGALLFILPGFYLAARCFLVETTMLVERRGNPLDAVVRSFVLTRGHGLMLMTLFLGIVLAGLLASGLVSGVADAGDAMGGAGVVLSVIGNALAAGISALTATALVLVKIAAYRHLAGAVIPR